MRKSSVIGLAVVSLFSAGSVARAQSTAPAPAQQRHAMRPRLEGRMGRGPLHGIALSDAEKTQVKEIRAKYATQSKSLREALRPAMKEAREARQKHDSSAVKAAWDKTADTRKQLQELATREQSDIRAVLTPEHQQLFDANVKQMEQRRAERAANGKTHRPGTRHRRDAAKG
jgi:Spy/CpxP family protein refolding chaperone